MWQYPFFGAIVFAVVAGAIFENGLGINNAMPILMIIVSGVFVLYAALLAYRRDVKLLPLAKVPADRDPKEYVRFCAIIIAMIGISMGMGAGLSLFGRAIQ